MVLTAYSQWVEFGYCNSNRDMIEKLLETIVLESIDKGGWVDRRIIGLVAVVRHSSSYPALPRLPYDRPPRHWQTCCAERDKYSVKHAYGSDPGKIARHNVQPCEPRRN